MGASDSGDSSNNTMSSNTNWNTNSNTTNSKPLSQNLVCKVRSAASDLIKWIWWKCAHKKFNNYYKWRWAAAETAISGNQLLIILTYKKGCKDGNPLESDSSSLVFSVSLRPKSFRRFHSACSGEIRGHSEAFEGIRMIRFEIRRTSKANLRPSEDSSGNRKLRN